MNGPFSLRHPLDGAVSAYPAVNANHVTIYPEPQAISVCALQGEETAVAATLDALAGDGLRRVGPGEWMVVKHRADSALLSDIKAKTGASALVTDQSNGRVILTIEGPDCRAILAKIVPVDLHPDAYPVGHSGNVFFAHVSAGLARIGTDRFEISLMRSFALFAFEELMEMGLEFDLTAGFAT